MSKDTIEMIDNLLQEGGSSTFRTTKKDLSPVDTDDSSVMSRAEAVKRASISSGVSDRGKVSEYLRYRQNAKSISQSANACDMELRKAMDVERALRDFDLLDNTPERGLTEKNLPGESAESERIDEIKSKLSTLDLTNENSINQFSTLLGELASLSRTNESARGVLETMQDSIGHMAESNEPDLDLGALLDEEDIDEDDSPDTLANRSDEELEDELDAKTMQKWLESDPDHNAMDVGEALSASLQDLLDGMSNKKQVDVKFDEVEGDEEVAIATGENGVGQDVILTVDYSGETEFFEFEVPEKESKVTMRLIPHEPMSNLSLYLQRTRDALAQKKYRYSEMDQPVSPESE